GVLGGGADGQTGLLGLGPRLRALLQTDAHLDAGVAQAQRVRVPLAAVADDRDLAALDDRQIRIVVVEDLDCHFRVPFVCAGLRRAGVLTYLAPHASCGDATALTVGPRPPVSGLAGLARGGDRLGAAAHGHHPRLHDLADPVVVEHAHQRLELVA